MNGCLPELCGLLYCIIVHPILTVRAIRRGYGSAAKSGNDGVIDTITSNRNRFPGVSYQDLNPDSQQMELDDLVVEEQERVEKIFKGELPQEALSVTNLKKFFITNPTK